MAILKKSDKKIEEAEIVSEVKKSRKDATKIDKSSEKISRKSDKSAKNSGKSGVKTNSSANDLSPATLREMSEKDLQAKLIESRNDLNDFHKMARANELPSSHVIRQMRKNIARIHTILTQKKFEKLNEEEAKS